jgi:CheY-like chemotaxis protein/two-component sensor histidine kinase
MVVEDEAVLALELRECLLGMGYIVPAVASSGDEAVARAGETAPDLVLMDIRLKGPMDGVEAARQIMTNFGIPVVYLTAYSDDTTVERAKESAPYGYVLKPWEEKSLQIVIDMALHKARLDSDVRGERDWYHTVLRYMGAPIVVCDLKGSVQFMNASAEELATRKPSGRRTMTVYEVLQMRHRRTKKPFALPIMDSILKGTPVHTRDFVILAAGDGTEVPVDLTFAPVTSDTGVIMGFTVIIRPEGAPAPKAPRPGKTRLEDGAPLHEFLQVELIRLLLLKQQKETEDERFVDGQLTAYQRIIKEFFGKEADGLDVGWQRRLVRNAIRDTHEQIRGIWMAQKEPPRSGTISSQRFTTYIDALTRRVVESAENAGNSVTIEVTAEPLELELDTAIYCALVVNEIVLGVVSRPEGPQKACRIEVSLKSDGPARLRLAVQHDCPSGTAQGDGGPGLDPLVMDTLVTELRGSVATDVGEATTFSVVFPR